MPNEEKTGTTVTLTLKRRELNLITRLLRKEFGRLGKRTAGGRLLRNLQKERYSRVEIAQLRDKLTDVLVSTPQGNTITITSDLEALIEAALAS